MSWSEIMMRFLWFAFFACLAMLATAHGIIYLIERFA
jgi:hypothetical protein